MVFMHSIQSGMHREREDTNLTLIIDLDILESHLIMIIEERLAMD